MRLLDPEPLGRGRVMPREEMRELAVLIAESGLTARRFARERGIPYGRALQAQNAFEGLIKQIRGPQPPKTSLAKKREQKRRRDRAYQRRKRRIADSRWRRMKENMNGAHSNG